jgi:nitroreductase
MVDFFEMVRRRRTIRSYESRPIEKEKLQAILECACAAPSAGNLQAYEIVVIEDEARKRALAQAALEQQQIVQAPVVLAFFQNTSRSSNKYGRRGEGLYSIQDATIACTYAQLAAQALGLGSCWIGAFSTGAVGELLKAPPGLTPVALLPIGYSAETPPAAERRSLSDLVRHETF